MESKQKPKQEDQPLSEKTSKEITQLLDKASSEAHRSEGLIHKLSEGIHNISSNAMHVAKDLIHKVFYEEEYPNPEKDLDPEIKENVKQINYDMTHRPHMKEKVIETQGKGGPEKHNLLERAKEGFHEISDKLFERMENITEKLHTEKPGRTEISKDKENEPGLLGRAQERITSRTEKNEPVDLQGLNPAPTEKISKSQLKDFHEVKTGFTETVETYQQEKRIEEIGQATVASNNPFEVLGSEKLNIAQPLASTEVVGGELPLGEKRTIGEDITNRYLEGVEEQKPLGEKLKEGVRETTSKIGTQIAETKEKILSGLSSHTKENVQEP